ncbi:MAG TPA: hypothetical protein PLN21_13230 [Gemmatales bacterium]|nr:hypothetical protein [Gemmatales bacterium]
MSPNMLKLLAIAGGIFGVGFVLFIVASRFYDGITERQEQLEKLQLDETALIGKLARLEKDKRDVEHWTAISMPGNINSAALTYKGFLQDLLLKKKVAIRSFSEPNRVTTNNRQGTPVVSHISYDIVFDATFAQLSSFLQEFYSLNVPHTIKGITIEPQGKGSDAKLLVTMKADALAMSNVKDRQSVIANPTITIAQLEMLMAIKRLPVGLLFGLSQLTNNGLYGHSKLASNHKAERNYAVMLQKNVFAGLVSKTAGSDTPGATQKADRDILKNTQLTSITANYITEEGLLRVRKTNKYVKLRAEGGVNEFEIRDASNLLVLKGKVLAIKPRELVFEYDGKAYLLQIGQFVEEALKHQLTAEDLKKYDAALTAVDQTDQAK